MVIKVYKCSDKKLKMHVKELTIRALSKLIPDENTFNNLSISIHIDHEKADRDKAWGFCEAWYVGRKRINHFTIVLSDKCSKKSFNTYLLHELVHVKQYVTKEIIDLLKGRCRWKGKLFKNVESISEDKAPWEIEAYELSEKLYLQLCT